MGGLAAAWRLSKPGWQEEFESITVYQRGWRLGGKGASSRGENARIEEHGLHIWLGWYENAFQILQECYEELDRPANRPDAPIRTMSEALIPSSKIGMADRSDDGWQPWVTDMPDNSREPGRSAASGRDTTLTDLLVQGVRLLDRYFSAISNDENSVLPLQVRSIAEAAPIVMAALTTEAIRMTKGGASLPFPRVEQVLQGAMSNDPRLGDPTAGGDSLRRTWSGVALTVAALRGIVADGLLTDPRGLGAINDEEYLSWIQRHGGPSDLGDFSVVRSLYDMVFGFVDGDTTRPALSAGTAVLFGGKTLFDYKGSVFWKMTAGMGDVVFAPLYEVLRQRGVDFEFFHRVDGLHPAKDSKRIESITIGRQARLLNGRHYDPLVLYRGLPCFPRVPQINQLADAEGIENHPLEAHWCQWPDAEQRVLRDGVDFDVIVFAIPPAMASFTCTELAAKRPEWRDMIDRLGTVATQSFQIWLGAAEQDVGWVDAGSTLSAFVEPFSTWASMPQLISVEDWPADATPGAIAYFRGALEAPIPTGPGDAADQDRRVRETAIKFLEQNIGDLLPGATSQTGFRWDLLCAGGDRIGSDRFDSQYWTANVDPSDRYVQSLPGTDRYRLRSDESGYDNLFLAGDWTDSGLNAGCIEAAVMSGLQAANAVRRRPRNDGIAGYFMP